MIVLMSVVLSISVAEGTTYTAKAQISSQTEKYENYVGGYITGNLDNDTPIYEPEYTIFADSQIPEKYPENMDEFKAKYPEIRDQGSYGACWAFSSI